MRMHPDPGCANKAREGRQPLLAAGVAEETAAVIGQLDALQLADLSDLDQQVQRAEAAEKLVEQQPEELLALRRSCEEAKHEARQAREEVETLQLQLQCCQQQLEELEACCAESDRQTRFMCQKLEEQEESLQLRRKWSQPAEKKATVRQQAFQGCQEQEVEELEGGAVPAEQRSQTGRRKWEAPASLPTVLVDKMRKVWVLSPQPQTVRQILKEAAAKEAAKEAAEEAAWKAAKEAAEEADELEAAAAAAVKKVAKEAAKEAAAAAAAKKVAKEAAREAAKAAAKEACQEASEAASVGKCNKKISGPAVSTKPEGSPRPKWR